MSSKLEQKFNRPSLAWTIYDQIKTGYTEEQAIEYITELLKPIEIQMEKTINEKHKLSINIKSHLGFK